jgi:hypothetical protein
MTLKIIPSEKAVVDSKGKGNPAYLNEIAESKELLEWNP